MNTSFKALLLKSRHQVYTLLSGHNLSKLHGEGYDFAELREYQIGDDIRKINWTITAKLGKPYIKELHANRELSVVVAALMDGGVYCDQGNAKQQYIAEIAAILGYATQHRNDLFTGLAYTPQQTFITPPTKQLFEIEQFVEHLYNVPLLHTALTPQNALDTLFKRLYKPSLLFIIDDFLTPVDLSLLAQRHEVIAIIVRHPQEEFPVKQGEITLCNPHSNTCRDTYIGNRAIQHYLTNKESNDEKMLEHFSRYDIRYVKILTHESPIEKLMKLFQ